MDRTEADEGHGSEPGASPDGQRFRREALLELDDACAELEVAVRRVRAALLRAMADAAG